MQSGGAEPISEIAHEPYLEVFGRFWEGMSYLIVSTNAATARLSTGASATAFAGLTASAALDAYLDSLRRGRAEWPSELLLWQSFAHSIIEAHGLLDEYLRATYELLSLAQGVSQSLVPGEPWEAESVERLQTMEAEVREESDRFGQLVLWNRISRMRKRFGLKIRFSRPLLAALKHQRWIRNGVVHGQLTPHVVMPDGSIGRMRAYPPPPYVPLGLHIVRGAMSVMLAAHREVDAAILSRLELDEDPLTAALMTAEIERGRDEWLADPWEPHPEHLFGADVLRAWRPEH